MSDTKNQLDQLCINTVRMLAVDAIEKANSGHPGMPLGASPMAFALFTKFMRHNPANPNWFNRDRFILSAGHASALLYSLLHITGYAISLDDLKKFRQLSSITPGHPEYGVTPGVDATTGPLGQGFAMGVGMALAERVLGKMFNKDGFDVVDHYTFAIVSDGDLMEGISSEAASLAGHIKLGKLIYLYDDNDISIDGNTDITFTENVQQRFEAYGWHTQTVTDANDLTAITYALETAEQETDKPSIIIVRSHIGYGSPKQDTSAAHGAPLGKEGLLKTKDFYGWDKEKSFFVPSQIAEFRKSFLKKTADYESQWNSLFKKYQEKYPAQAKQLSNLINGILPEGWDNKVKNMSFKSGEGPMATRDASGKFMNAAADGLINLIGGSADLGSSVKTTLKNYPAVGGLTSTDKLGRNIYFGVREHAMGAIVNGLALHGGIIPFCSTFFVFSDYMRSSIRLAALMNIHSIFVFSHDSIGVGEDGPTHQPIEHLASLRAMPNMNVIRPADANETIAAWKYALTAKKPVTLILSRQKLPVLEDAKYSTLSNIDKGGYILSDSDGTPDCVLISSGSEVSVILEAKKILDEKGVKTRVVSLPSWELFDAQNSDYKNSVIPQNIKIRVAVEAGSTMGWHKYVGDCGYVIGIDEFGSSAPGDVLFEKYNITAENVVKKTLGLIKK
ncbi:transketolase [bacterium]|nr:transketolase [bacterium]